MELKEDRSLFACLMTICKSCRDIDIRGYQSLWVHGTSKIPVHRFKWDNDALLLQEHFDALPWETKLNSAYMFWIKSTYPVAVLYFFLFASSSGRSNHRRPKLTVATICYDLGPRVGTWVLPITHGAWRSVFEREKKKRPFWNSKWREFVVKRSSRVAQ